MLMSTHSSFDEFAFHLHTNTIGPIITANRLLQTNIPIGTIVFMSSDSGSHGNFREMEDGFAAYAASKAALNMAVRHLAAELKRKDDDTIILAMHPGEVATDMANVQLPWEVQGIITPEESVAKMIEVIKSKGIQHSGTFWTYENKVSCSFGIIVSPFTDFISPMFGNYLLGIHSIALLSKKTKLHYVYTPSYIVECISLSSIS
jgi:NAD(P)-dependent dehydrogenase (short-subunit alcohol dehydrogenase family)